MLGEWKSFIGPVMSVWTGDVRAKLLPPHSLTDPATRKRFRKEALTLSKLNHPNIAMVFHSSIPRTKRTS